MTCRDFEARLDGLLAGTLDPEDRRRVEAHLEVCERCRDLRAAIRASLEAPPGSEVVDLAAGVLHRTSGSACGRARDLLPDLADRVLEGLDAALVQGHVEHCDACAGLLACLERNAALLPGMAEVDPGAGFTAEVIRRTGRAAAAGWRHRLERWWERLLQRPRLAWEGAYVGAMVAVLLFGTPLSPLREVPARALDLARTNPVQVVEASMSPLPAVGARIADYGGKVWSVTGGALVESTRPARAALGQKAAFAWEMTVPLRRHGAQGWEALLDGDFQSFGARLGEMGMDVKILWIRLTTADPETAGGKPGSEEV
ncbi:MAG: zf-HC2 domain-containing protein [Acidobacteriota bacterium]|jgi:predicted anti-sigma-YlaC factor YlaD